MLPILNTFNQLLQLLGGYYVVDSISLFSVHFAFDCQSHFSNFIEIGLIYILWFGRDNKTNPSRKKYAWPTFSFRSSAGFSNADIIMQSVNNRLLY